MTATVQDVVDLWTSYYPQAEPTPVEVILAAYSSIYIANVPPTWLAIVAPPAMGKTEILRSFSKVPDSVYRDDFTHAALSSGVSRTKEGDMLPDLRRKVLIVKDLTTMLSGPSHFVSKLFGTLRSIRDGFFSKQTALGGLKSWEGQFGLLMACTNILDRHPVMQRSVGERLIRVRFHAELRPTRQQRIHRATVSVDNVGKGEQEEIRRQVAEATGELMGSLGQKVKPPVIGSTNTQRMVEWAEFVARARAPVERDMHHEMRDEPEIEDPTRLAADLAVLAQSLALLRADDSVGPRQMAIIQQVAFDCLRIERIKVIRFLASATAPSSVMEAFKGSGMRSYAVTRYALEDLEALGVVEARGNPHANRYSMGPDYKSMAEEMAT